MIDWTQVEWLDSLYDEGATEWVIDGTDQGFLESPWNEADEGDAFAMLDSQQNVVIGRKGDDHVQFWIPINQDVAKKHLIQSRIAVLRERRLRDLEELGELLVD